MDLFKGVINEFMLDMIGYEYQWTSLKDISFTGNHEFYLNFQGLQPYASKQRWFPRKTYYAILQYPYMPYFVFWGVFFPSEKPSQNDSESKWIPNWVDPAGCSHSKVHSIAREVAIVSSFATVLPLIFTWHVEPIWLGDVRCEDDIFGSRIKSSPRLETSKVDHQAVWNLQSHMAGQWKSKSHPMQITMVLGMENWHGKNGWTILVLFFFWRHVMPTSGIRSIKVGRTERCANAAPRAVWWDQRFVVSSPKP